MSNLPVNLLIVALLLAPLSAVAQSGGGGSAGGSAGGGSAGGAASGPSAGTGSAVGSPTPARQERARRVLAAFRAARRAGLTTLATIRAERATLQRCLQLRAQIA